MGGIASVTRSCAVALRHRSQRRNADVFPEESAAASLERFIAYHPGRRKRTGPSLSSQPSFLAPDLRFVDCRGSKARFVAEVCRQSFGRPDLVLHEHLDLAQAHALIPRPLRRACVLWCHGIELWRELPPRKIRAIREADFLLFNSAFTRERAARFHPWILEQPYRVVPLCREEDPTPSSSTGPTERKPWILTTGRLVADRPKGHREILDALPELRKRIPGLQWHVTGSGPWFAPLASLVAGSPARDAVVLHGFAAPAELDRLYRECRVFAMPSQGEGFGIVYAEAMARGLPCVGSTLDAAPEVIGEAGLCIDPSDPAALVAALSRYLDAGPEEYARYEQAALERATHYRPERFARDLKDALAEAFLRWRSCRHGDKPHSSMPPCP